ncbi:MAG: DUF4838 domain-containing protein [Opitutales bacterium]
MSFARIRSWSLSVLSLVLSTALLQALPRGGKTAFTQRPGFDLAETVIVLPNEASDTLQLAAQELALHLERLGHGARPTVEESVFGTGSAIFLGETQAASAILPDDESLDRDGYRIRKKDTRLVIRGGSDQGTLFGVYGLLQDHLDVYWLEPGPAGISLPEHPRQLPRRLMERVEPSYLSREVAGLRSVEDRVWARRNRLAGRYLYNHHLFRIFTPQVAQQHPEFFPIIDGERRLPRRRSAGNPQPHLASEAVVDFTAQAAAAYFRDNPDAPTFSIGQNDSRFFDEGPETASIVEPFGYFRKVGDYSPLVFGFSNAVAERLEPAFPEKKLGVLAYDVTQNVPPFPMHRNVLPYLAADRFNWMVPEFAEEDKALIRAWSQSGVETFGLFDYTYGYGFFFPRNSPHWVEAIQYAHAYGASGYIADSGFIADWDAPKLWLIAQVLWNVEADVERLADAYGKRISESGLSGIVNPVAGDWEAMRWVYGEPRWLKGFYDLGQFSAYQMWSVALDSLRAFLESGHELIADSTPRLERVRDWLLLSDYASQWAALGGRTDDLVRKERLTVFELSQRDIQTRFLKEGRSRWRTGPFSGLFRQMLQTSPVHRLALEEGWAEFFDGLDAEGLAALQATAPVNVNANFQRRLFFEQGPLNYAKLREYRRVPGYQLAFSNSEGLAFDQSFEAAQEGRFGLSLENAETFTLSCAGPVQPGEAVLATLPTRGQVGPGTRHSLLLGWKDANGTLIQPVHEDRLPPHEAYPDWVRLTAYGHAPERAAFWFAAWVVQYQESGDWAHADALEVRVLKASEAPANSTD